MDGMLAVQHGCGKQLDMPIMLETAIGLNVQRFFSEFFIASYCDKTLVP